MSDIPISISLIHFISEKKNNFFTIFPIPFSKRFYFTLLHDSIIVLSSLFKQVQVGDVIYNAWGRMTNQILGKRFEIFKNLGMVNLDSGDLGNTKMTKSTTRLRAKPNNFTLKACQRGIRTLKSEPF